MVSPIFVKPIVICGKSYYPVPFNADAALSITGLCVDLQQNQVQLTNMTKDNFQGETRKTIYGATLRRDGRMCSRKYNADGTARNGVHRENLVSLIEMDGCVVIPYDSRKLEKEYQLITRDGNLVRLHATDDRLLRGVIHKTDSILIANWWRVGNCLGACSQGSDNTCDLFIIVRKSDMDTINVRKANEEKERQRRCKEQANAEMQRFVADRSFGQRIFDFAKAADACASIQVVLKPAPEIHYISMQVSEQPIIKKDARLHFNLTDYILGGYELYTRNGMAVSDLEYTGKGDIILRGVDNMSGLKWNCNGQIEANKISEFDLVMVKV